MYTAVRAYAEIRESQSASQMYSFSKGSKGPKEGGVLILQRIQQALPEHIRNIDALS